MVQHHRSSSSYRRQTKMAAATALLVLLAFFNLLRFRRPYHHHHYHHYSEDDPATAAIQQESSPKSDKNTAPVFAADTTIIITSSLIPSHPSLELINQTIASLRHIQGLPSDTPIIITVDGLPKNGRKEDSRMVLNQYIQSLGAAYNNSSSSSSSNRNITILPQEHQIYLVGNVRMAIQKAVRTEFVYLIQHDFPFISPIDHPALVQTFRDYPEEVRLVRFSRRKTLVRNRDKMGLCGTKVDLEANGIALAKTHTWSDNNHFTRKSYYDEMFFFSNNSSTFKEEDWEGVRAMETVMNDLGAQNCSYWGTYLYGKQGEGPPMIVHLDGRKYKNPHPSI